MGTSCALVSVWFILIRPFELQIAIAAVFFLVICIVDAWKSKIPNLANASLALAGLAFNFYTTGSIGLTTSLLGIIAGLGLLLIPYLMGGFGAGDVKALAALGALIGPGGILQVFIYMAFYGALLAALHYLTERNLKQKLAEGMSAFKFFLLTGNAQELAPKQREKLRFPYAVAIALGYYSWVANGNLI